MTLARRSTWRDAEGAAVALTPAGRDLLGLLARLPLAPVETLARLYWLVSPEAAIVEVLTLAGDRYQTHARVAGDEPLSSLVLLDLNCAAARIFQ